MPPNPACRENDHARLDALIREVSFGMVFLPTPERARIAAGAEAAGKGPLAQAMREVHP